MDSRTIRVKGQKACADQFQQAPVGESYACLPFLKIGCTMVVIVMHDKLVRNEDDLDELLVFENARSVC